MTHEIKIKLAKNKLPERREILINGGTVGYAYPIRVNDRIVKWDVYDPMCKKKLTTCDTLHDVRDFVRKTNTRTIEQIAYGPGRDYYYLPVFEQLMREHWRG